MAQKLNNAIRQYLAKIGGNGGKARVAKGVSALSPEERRRRGREAAEKRWARARAARAAMECGGENPETTTTTAKTQYAVKLESPRP